MPLQTNQNSWAVSIPQAVGTIAILYEDGTWLSRWQPGFNTASGRYYCNENGDFESDLEMLKFQYRKR